ncbi:GAF domain-containing protein [Nocardia australiensis]|uniref:GAF domain-containing protein n=1 Tax=Nocardia australiensis TaxID=2887191 RepID=UPI001D151B23|nr:GAF domain-containing protein [Nocardia australiensis]
MGEGEWLVIDTLSDTPTVIAAGSRARKWRPLANVYRGSSLAMVQKLVGVVVDNLKDSQTLVDLTPGTRLAYARPILGPQRHVHAVMVWLGAKETNPPPPPRAIGWTWELRDGFPEPVTSAGVASFYGLAEDRDPTLTELLSTATGVSELVDLLAAVEGIEEGQVGTGELPIIRPDGRITRVRYAFRCVRGTDGLAIQGISHELADHVESRGESLPARILSAVGSAGELYPALVHRVSGRVLAWLAKPPVHLPPAVIRGVAAAPVPQYSAVLPGLPESVALSIF